MKQLLLLAAILFSFSSYAQLAEEKTAPFGAVKSANGKTLVYVQGEWYTPVSINKIPAKDILEYCKREYEDKWLKRFSEDLVEVMEQMGKPLPQTVSVTLSANGQQVTKTLAMTKENRRAAWNYNNNNELPKATSTPTSTAGRSRNVDKATAKAVNLSMDKPYTIKSAKIEYTYEGGKMFAGKETVYIDDYGKTVVVITDKPGIMGQKDNKTTIWKDNKTTQIDHASKTWQSFAIRVKSTEPPVIAYSNETQRRQGGYEQQADAAVAGKNCEVYKHKSMDVTYWLWHNIDLKLRNYSQGKNGYIKTATSVQEGITIPASVLKVPAGYTKR